MAALTGCVDSCDCGGGAPASQATAARTRTAAGETAAGQAGGTGSHLPYRTILKPLADTEQARELHEQQGRLRAALARPGNEPLASHETLSRFLADTLADYTPSGSVVVGPAQNDGHAVSVASRRYQRGASELYVKITDTAQAGPSRAPFIEELTQQGSGPWGSQQGRMLAGQPAVVRSYARGGAFGQLLISGRYMVELRLRPSGTADDLEQLAGQLPLTALGGGAWAKGAAGQGG